MKACPQLANVARAWPAVEEGWFENGRWIPSRQLAGDETGQGQNLSLRSHPADRNPDRFAGIQHFTLYRYR